MKNIFVINPVAGQRAGGREFIRKIVETAERLNADYEVYITTCVGDASLYVYGRCHEREDDEELRFFSCGGDGTLNEVANGLYGFENVSFGVIPIGTGNDFIRNFGTAEQFLDIEAQILGKNRVIDSIAYENEYDGRVKTGYIVNMINIGLDANAAEKTAELKQKPLISGSLAYILGVATMFVKKKGASLRIESDGEVLVDGKVLLSAITNGCYCGGGWKGIPNAITDDGLLDISIVRDITRRQFIGIVQHYQKGTHLETELGKKIVSYYQRTNTVISAVGESMRVCIDGEMVDSDRIALTIKPASLHFIVPAGI